MAAKLQTMDWDAVAPLNPFDRVAGRVTSKGTHFDPYTTPGKVHSSEPIPFRSPTKHELSNPQFQNLVGERIGRLVVLGIASEIKGNGKSGQAWTVRCVCGAYEVRRTKYLKACVSGNNPGQEEPCCDWCKATRKLQMGFGRGKKAIKEWSE